MAVPYTFGTATASIPLSQLDSNFATVITLGNTAIQLGNTVTTLNNMTLANVTISSGNITLTNVSATTANVTTANVVTMIITGNETVQGNTTVTGTITGAKLIPTGSSVTGNGLYLPAANALGLSTNGTNAVYIDASQNVGIATTVQKAKLQVNPGNVSTVGAIASSGLMIENYSGVGNLSQIGFGYATSSLVNTTAYIGLIETNGAGNSYGDLVFGTRNVTTDTVPTERMRIDSSGNVGIGTSSIGARLQIASGATALATYIASTATPAYSATSYNGANALLALISGGASGAFNGIRLSQGGSSEALFGLVQEAGGAGAFVFQGYNGSAYAERMRIDSSGNLLVGATSYQGSGLSLSSPNGSGCYSVLAAGGTGYHWRFGNISNGIVGSITTSTSATSFNPSSDERLKTNIVRMTDGIARVMKLRPVTYTWKTDNTEDDGFIAQDLQKIPEFARRVNPINEIEGETYYGVDYMRFVSVLTAAIQEQQALITSLTARIEALEAK